MAKYVNVRKCFIIFGYILQSVYTGTTYTSNACYGTDPHCTRHDLSCNSSQKIAIHDAYYTNNTECTQTGLSSCGKFSADSVAEYGYHRFNNIELVSLYRNCSTKRHCVYPAPRRGATRTFSVVKYQCIEDLQYSKDQECSDTASNPFDVRCQTVTSTGDITTRPNKDVLSIPTSSRFPPDVFIGGVAAGAVVILVGLAVYVLVIRRLYDLTVKKQGDTPASVEHPTYSGLSAGADVNNYTSIEQTSRSQKDTAHGSTATPDYQNI